MGIFLSLDHHPVSTGMKSVRLTLIVLLGILRGSFQQCDPIFDDPCPEEPCDPVFADCPRNIECFDSTNEIDNAIFAGDTRQAFNDCDPSSTCEKYAEEGYVCAPSWTCKNNTIITDGKGLIDVRTVDEDIFGTDEPGEPTCAEPSGTVDASDSKCDKPDYVCCKKPNFRATKCTPENRRRKTGGEKEKLSQCGRASAVLTITGKDRDSQEANPGEFPHMCVIYRFEQGQRIYVGGASLIARNLVLTVAHKFYVINKGKTVDRRDSISNFHVRCGEHNVKTETELLDSQESEVEKLHIHPEYNPKRVYYNLAILQTKENFVYQKHIGPVCLPNPQENFEASEDCWSSGWGADAYDSYAIYSDQLKKVKMPIVPSDQCERRLKSHKRFKNKQTFRIHNSWICIGGEKNSDTCKGDGGSPHVCKDSKDRWVQVGAVAWGVGCGEEVPSVYSSVPNSMCWIDWVMSCVPPAQYDIDNTFVEDLDIRGASVESVNKLTSEDCGAWKENNFELKNICDVIYVEIDTRGGGRK